MKQERQGEIYVLSATALWGIFPVLTAVTYFTLSPLLSLFATTAFAALAFLVLVLVRQRGRELRNRAARKDILLATLFIAILLYVFYFLGLRYTTPGNASLIGLTEVFFTYLFFNLWRGEKIRLRHLGGALLVTVGAVVVLLPAVLDNFSLNRGDLLILIGTLCAPLGNFYQRRARERVSSETILFIRSAVAAPVVLLLAYLLGERLTGPAFFPALPYLAVSGIFLLGFSKIFWIESLHRLPVVKATALGSTGPLLTLLFAYLILHQLPTAFQLVSFVPLFFGVILLTSDNHKRKLPA